MSWSLVLLLALTAVSGGVLAVLLSWPWRSGRGASGRRDDRARRRDGARTRAGHGTAGGPPPAAGVPGVAGPPAVPDPPLPGAPRLSSDPPPVESGAVLLPTLRARQARRHLPAGWRRPWGAPAARVPAPEPDTDPFDALTVQTRLAIVAEHLRRLDEDRHAWARAERIIASQLAYDALLAEACRLAGVEVLPRAKGDPWERLREEVELAARGWTW